MTDNTHSASSVEEWGKTPRTGVGMSAERVEENRSAIAETFGSR